MCLSKEGTCLSCRHAKVTPGIRATRMEPAVYPEAECRIEDEVMLGLEKEEFGNADYCDRPVMCGYYDEVKVPDHELWE